jgi:hypothetical protein
VHNLEDYLPHQLKAMLTPAQVEKEFGLSKATLKYWRECTKDTGILHGPAFFNDGNVNLYQRKTIILYVNSKMFSGSETSETSKTRGSKSIREVR